MRVDRKARDMMIRAIVKYMNGQTKSFSFSDEIAEADCLAEDQDVHNIRLALWMSYDDIKDHIVSASQDGWEAYRRAISYLMTDLVAPP